MGYKNLVNLPDGASLGRARKQLSVGKRSCTALSKLNIRFRIEDAVLPEFLNSLDALLHRFSSFQDNRFKTHLRKDQSCEHACRAESNHDGTIFSGTVCNRHLISSLRRFFQRKLLAAGKL